MALRTIVKDGDAVLKKKSRPVTAFDNKLAMLLDDMAETMLEANGLGLAAPQVGVLRRVFIALYEEDLDRADYKEFAKQMAAAELEEDQKIEADPEGDGTEETDEDFDEDFEGEDFEIEEPIIMEFINPEIISEEGSCRDYEGCLSFPGDYAAITRPIKVTVRAQNRHGEFFETTAEGMFARCLCHETNHLDGIVLDDLAEFYMDAENPQSLDDEPADENEE